MTLLVALAPTNPTCAGRELPDPWEALSTSCCGLLQWETLCRSSMWCWPHADSVGWAAVVLTVLPTPGHALVHLSLGQVLLLLELFKYQRKALVLNCLVFSHGETSAELSNFMAPSS